MNILLGGPFLIFYAQKFRKMFKCVGRLGAFNVLTQTMCLYPKS